MCSAGSRFLAVMLVTLGLSGCGGTQVVKTVTETTATTVGTTEPTAETAPTTTDAGGGTTSKLGGTITLRGGDSGEQIQVTLLSVRDPAPSSDSFIQPDPGNRYVGIRLRLRNVGTTVYNDSPSNGASVIDRADQEFSASIFAAVKPELGSPTIRPGDQRVGWITVEVPKTSRLRTFQFTLSSGFGPETGEWSLG